MDFRCSKLFAREVFVDVGQIYLVSGIQYMLGECNEGKKVTSCEL